MYLCVILVCACVLMLTIRRSSAPHDIVYDWRILWSASCRRRRRARVRSNSDPVRPEDYTPGTAIRAASNDCAHVQGWALYVSVSRLHGCTSCCPCFMPGNLCFPLRCICFCFCLDVTAIVLVPLNPLLPTIVIHLELTCNRFTSVMCATRFVPQY